MREGWGRAMLGGWLAVLGASAAVEGQDAPPTARVVGFVVDSLAGRALAGATVQLVSLRDPARMKTMRSGENGAFAFDSLPPGEYALGFFHPRLDSLGIDPTMGKVTLAAGDAARAPLAIPSAATLIGQWCGARTVADTMGAVVGTVRSAVDGAPTPGATVYAQWMEVTLGDRGLQRRTPTVRTTGGADGRFVLCGVPPGSPVIVRAWAGGDSSGFSEVEVPAYGVLARSFMVAPAMGAGGSGGGVVRGTVRRADGAPIDGARVLLWGTDRETTSAHDGTYAVGGVAPGTRTIEARAIGYLPRREAVDVMAGEGVVRELQLQRAPPVLDTIRVQGSRGETWKQREFEGRRKQGFGTFLTDSAITARNPVFTSDLFRAIPGVYVQPGMRRGYTVLMRGGSNSEYCIPAIFIDGTQVVSEDGVIDDLVNPQEIQAVEVYSRTGSSPLAYSTLNGCGSIVFWTGGRGAR